MTIKELELFQQTFPKGKKLTCVNLSDYEINFYVNKFLESKKQDKTKLSAKIRNRRYQALRQLEQQGYFSIENMRLRQPSLYNEFIGKHQDQYKAFDRGMTLYEVNWKTFM